MVISVISGKGGVGKTVVSTNLAWIIAKDFNMQTLLIDANITSSHISSVMKIPTTYTLNQLFGHHLNVKKIPVFKDVLHVLPARVFMSSRDYSSLTKLKDVIKELRRRYDVIIIDSAPGIGREALAAIQAADTCLIVTTPYFPAIVDVLRIKRVLKELRNKRARVVLNMVEKKVYELSEDEIKYSIGFPLIGCLPFDEKVLESVAMGELIAVTSPYSPFVRNLRKIAYYLLSEEFYVEMPSPWQTFLRRIKELLTLHTIRARL